MPLNNCYRSVASTVSLLRVSSLGFPSGQLHSSMLKSVPKVLKPLPFKRYYPP
ncbi:MAG: hypothetical protein ACFE9L_21755 [Candidatus Hodarchaeota archaeon]